MRRECRERFPRHRLQRKPLVSNPGMHHDTCVTHVSWCISGSLTRSGGVNVSGIPGASAICNFRYLVRDTLLKMLKRVKSSLQPGRRLSWQISKLRWVCQNWPSLVILCESLLHKSGASSHQTSGKLEIPGESERPLVNCLRLVSKFWWTRENDWPSIDNTVK